MTNDISRVPITADATNVDRANAARASRRAVLMGIAAAGSFPAPVITTVALSTSVDPIFAAIKRERDAFAVYRVTYEVQSGFDD
jgi:hypothetical protein